MFFRTFIVSAVILVMGLQASGHAIVTPALGVKGNGTRNDVQRPSTAKPCGKASLTAIDTSTPAIAAADGTAQMTITDFNGGVDGSREIKSTTIDETGTGKSFKAAPANTVAKNGDKAPSKAGSQQLTIKLPAGTKCTGGKNKDLCLMSLTTDGGFGNCVVIQQGGAETTAAGNSNAAVTSGAAASGAKAKNNRRTIGFRAVRAHARANAAEIH